MATKPSAIRKITLEVPAELLEQAQRATGAGVTETVRQGLEAMAAARARQILLEAQGTVRSLSSWKRLKEDR